MNSSGIQLRMGDIVYAIFKRWKLILALTFVGLVFGIMLSGVSYIQGNFSNYEITGSFVIQTKSDEGNFTSYNTDYQHPSDYNFAADVMDSVIYIIKSELTMDRAIQKLKFIGVTPRDISQNLGLTQYNSTPIVELRFTWRSAEEGIRILNMVLDTAQETLQETLDVGALVMINEPIANRTISGTLGGNIWGYTVILGFFAGIGIAVLELLMRPTITNLKDVEVLLGLETIGTIPKDDKYFRKKNSLLVEDEVRSPGVTQNFSSAAFILRNRLREMPAPHCFYVTSATAGEGRTTVAANLAIQLSDMEQKVLLIDMDMRNPILGKLFLNHVDYDRSLNALYRGQATKEDSIFTLTGYLDILPAVMERQPLPIDGSIVELLKEISKEYDYVIMDSSPVGQISETLSLNAVADTVLFVLKYDSAPIPDIQSALEKLDKSGIRVIGCVINGAQSGSRVAMGEEEEWNHIHRRHDVESGPIIWENSTKENIPRPSKEKKSDMRKAEDTNALAELLEETVAPRMSENNDQYIMENLLKMEKIEKTVESDENVSSDISESLDNTEEK